MTIIVVVFIVIGVITIALIYWVKKIKPASKPAKLMPYRGCLTACRFSDACTSTNPFN